MFIGVEEEGERKERGVARRGLRLRLSETVREKTRSASRYGMRLGEAAAPLVLTQFLLRWREVITEHT